MVRSSVSLDSMTQLRSVQSVPMKARLLCDSTPNFLLWGVSESANALQPSTDFVNFKRCSCTDWHNYSHLLSLLIRLVRLELRRKSSRKPGRTLLAPSME